MWWHFLFSGLVHLDTQAHFAPAPIRWEGLDGRSPFLAPAFRDGPSMGRQEPQRLSIVDYDAIGSIPPARRPLFVAQPDGTIALDGTGLCIEAFGGPDFDVRLHRCTGEATQKWNWLSAGPIQLQGTNRCLDVTDPRHWSGAVVALRKCENKLSEFWTLEDMPREPKDASPARHVMSYFASAFGLGILSLSAFLGGWRKRLCLVSSNRSSMCLDAEQGGVSLVEFSGVPLFPFGAQWLQPIVHQQLALRSTCRSHVVMLGEERNYYNGGERVTSKNTPVRFPWEIETDDDPESDSRRLIVLGLAAQPLLWLGAQAINNSFFKPAPTESESPLIEDLADRGGGNIRPRLELKLDDVMEAGGATASSEAASIVPLLEERGGSQLGAAFSDGYWALPWVGGWQRIWANSTDASYLGGPKAPTFRSGGTLFSQSSARQFVYGPGEGGIVIEYLHTSDKGRNKLVLVRQGDVTNLGGNTFQLDFEKPLREFEVKTDESTGNDMLATGQPLTGSVEHASLTGSLLLQTTYLSENLWIVRDLEEPERVAVFRRTDTRSVMDQRGLVAEGQLKPPSDETIRYGRLLFSASAEDYAGWEAKAEKDMAQRDKLLGR